MLEVLVSWLSAGMAAFVGYTIGHRHGWEERQREVKAAIDKARATLDEPAER